jgi:hypothetical protein
LEDESAESAEADRKKPPSKRSKPDKESNDSRDLEATNDQEDTLSHLDNALTQFDDQKETLAHLGGALTQLVLSDNASLESAEAKENDMPHPTNGKGNSKAHDLIMEGHIALVSFDVETGGEECGVCQISAVAFDLEGKSLSVDFDFYVKPPPSAK